MEARISATELGRHLSDILNRVRYRHERFVVERNGEAIATLAPVVRSDFTFEDFIELLKRAPRPDDQFAGDLEAVQAEQPPASMPEWPT
jgi:prevent-host-death family protein